MIIVIHENNEWIPPFENAFKKLNLVYDFWYLPEIDLNLSDTPPDAVFYNRMSASSHSRNHRYEPELAIGILEWLEKYDRTVINGSRALDLEISKIRQYQELEKFDIDTPPTYATIRKSRMLDGANKIGYPLISKHNRAGKGLGVFKFTNMESLKNYIISDEFQPSPDGINLIQKYISAPTNSIIRLEFIGSKFLYAVEVDTTDGFELCPSDNCNVESNCPTGVAEKFRILKNFKLDNIQKYEKFLIKNNIGIAGIEIIIDEKGKIWTYDVNTNTNYNPQAEAKANISAPLKIAKYLKELADQKNLALQSSSSSRRFSSTL